MSGTDVLVVGGGISGLAIAQRLARHGVRVEVWEKDARPGGKIRSDSQDGYLTEQAAAMLLNFRPEVTRFITEAGLDDFRKPRATTGHRYVVSDGRLTALPMKLGPLLASDVWSTRGKLRLLLEPFVPRSGSRDESVSEFITRRLGREVLDKTMGPYVAGLLASDPEQANASSVLPRLVALEKRYGSITMGVLVHRLLKRKAGTATEAFSFRDGMATLVRLLADDRRVSVRSGHTVTGLSRTVDGWQVAAETSGGDRLINARQLVISTPAYAAAALLQRHSAALAHLLGDIEYASLSVVHTGFARNAIEHPLDGNGFLMQRNNSTSLIGCMWMSSLFSNHAPEGKVLLSNYLGGAAHPAAVAWSDERLLGETLTTLKPFLGLRGEPEMARINRHRRALPLYHGDYYRRMQRLDRLLAALPGLHVAANYRGGISVRDRLACAMSSAEKILRSLESASPTTYSMPGLILEPQN